MNYPVIVQCRTIYQKHHFAELAHFQVFRFHQHYYHQQTFLIYSWRRVSPNKSKKKTLTLLKRQNCVHIFVTFLHSNGWTNFNKIGYVPRQLTLWIHTHIGYFLADFKKRRRFTIRQKYLLVIPKTLVLLSCGSQRQ